MKRSLVTCLRAGLAAAALVFLALPLLRAQSAEPAITLLPPPGTQFDLTTAAQHPEMALQPGGAPYAAYFRRYAETRVGRVSRPEVFMLHFSRSTQIRDLKTVGDFRLNGGTCAPGHTYPAGATCTVEMVFAPTGPGHRSGRLVVENSATAEPFLVPGGGLAKGPVVSFVPAQLGYIRATFVDGGTGLLKNPQSLAVDGGDNLYIADTGNNLIRYRDSSGVLTTIVGGGTNSSQTYMGPPLGVQLSSPYGVTVNEYGDVFVSDTGASVVRVQAPWQMLDTIAGGGSGSSSCLLTAPCMTPWSIQISPPLGITHDHHTNLFLNVSMGASGGLPVWLQSFPVWEMAQLTLTGWTQSSSAYPIAADDNDTIYTAIEIPANYSGTYIVNGPSPYCGILAQNALFSWGDQPGADIWIVAGTQKCGFSGDGGLAAGAEISTSVQGLTLDAAGNFYFTDTGNNRVRRIDAATGIVHTIAGNGWTLHTSFGQPSTWTALRSPTGLAVDSQGRVYVTEQWSDDGTAVVVQIGPNGMQNFPAQRPTTTSTPQTVLVTNSGNLPLNIGRASFTAGDVASFATDAGTTTCSFTVPLQPGRSCNLGFVFNSTDTSTHTATYTLFDDTLNGMNQILLSGTGSMETVTPSSLSFGSVAVGSSSAAQKVTLTNPNGPPLGVNSVTITGPNAGDYAQTNNCPALLAGGRNCVASVTFSPLGANPSSATLNFNTTSGTFPVSLGGMGSSAVHGLKLSTASHARSSHGGVEVRATLAGATGTVMLREGNQALATAKLAGGNATFHLTLSPGTHRLTARYPGDAAHAACDSNTLELSISR